MKSPFSAEQIFHYCPQCGAQEFFPVDVKKFQCRACQFQYYFNANGAVAGIIQNGKGEILLTRREHDPAAGMLDLPGGFIDFEETAEEALHREIQEELHLEISHLQYVCSFPNHYIYAGLLYHTIDFFYTCRAVNLSTLRAQDEISGYQFTKISAIHLDEIGLQSIRRGLAYLRDRIQE